MGRNYGHLSAVERNFLQSRLNMGDGQGAIARALGRSPSTISREIARFGASRSVYDAAGAGQAGRARRRRGAVKLREGSALRSHVFDRLRQSLSEGIMLDYRVF